MKLTLALLVTTALGFGGYRAATAPVPPAADGGACKVSVECTPAGKCLVRCESPDGKVCVQELECDGEKCSVKACKGAPCPPSACK
jgi:hypothetical protein